MRDSAGVLLIDDFSGVHINLLKVLADSGHDARLLSSGDGYKSMLYSGLRLSVGSLQQSMLSYLVQCLRESRSAHIIQFVNLYRPAIYVNLILIILLKLWRKEVRYYAVGTDPTFLHGGKFLRHFAWDNATPPKYSWPSIRTYYVITSLVEVFVPNRTYAIGFESRGRRVSKLFYPRFPKELISNVSKEEREKFIFYAPKSRGGFKGYIHIEDACRLLAEQYRSKGVDILKTTRIPFDTYLKNVANCDVLIDQCISSDYAMNTILGLEFGKIVLCGVSKEHLIWAGIDIEQCPVKDIMPYRENILEVCVSQIGMEHSQIDTETYLEKYHGSDKILKQFFKLED